MELRPASPVASRCGANRRPGTLRSWAFPSCSSDDVRYSLALPATAWPLVVVRVESAERRGLVRRQWHEPACRYDLDPQHPSNASFLIASESHGGGGYANSGASSGQPAPATTAGPAREELRLAVVLNGGVSLAIWMGGVAHEIDRLAKATDGRAPMAELLKWAGSTARVDVITGTSAGGINGAALALSTCNEEQHGAWVTCATRGWTAAASADCSVSLSVDPRRPCCRGTSSSSRS